MKVYVFPADLFGCGHYRMIWPAQALRAEGHDVEIMFPNTKTNAFGQKIAGLRAVMEGDRLVDVQYPRDADVIVFQRPTHRQLSQAVPLLREKGVAVVIDMDDDLSSINPRNPAYAQVHPRNEHITQHSWHNAERACRDATMVTLSASKLIERYGSHGRYRILHNYVPGAYLDVEHEDSTTVGWAGSVHSHPDDLQVVGPSMARLIREGVPFLNVGTGTGVQDALGTTEEINSSGLVELDNWPSAVTRLGIGIAPLADTIFNAGKSWLKPLEYTATGVPWVASPRAEYRRLHRLGIGLLAQRPKDWYRQVRRLVNDESLRLEMSAAGREVVREHLVVEDNAWRWAEAWSEAVEIQRSGSTARSASRDTRAGTLTVA